MPSTMGKTPASNVRNRPARWYKALFQSAPVMYVVTEEAHGDPVVVACNDLFARTLGHRPSEVVGRSILDFAALDTEGWISSEDAMGEVELRAHDGRSLFALMRASTDPAENGSPRRQRLAFIDVTEERRVEIARREREASHRALLEAIPDKLIRIWRSKGKLFFEPVRDASALDPEALVDVETCHRSFPDAVARRFERPFEMALLGVTPSVRYELEVDHELHHLEARLVKRSNHEVLAVVQDVTGHKEIERQLQESQRLEALGRLAGGISHDFNNLLTIIAGNAELLLTKRPSDDPADQVVREIAAAAARATELTRQLLAFSSRQVLEPKPVNANALLLGMEAMLRRLIREDIRIQMRTEENPGAILADPGRIEQVIMNLAVNSRDAMPNGGTLCFATEACELHETRVEQGLRIPPGTYVKLTVSDTGIGIDERARSHIFEPFFTTKASGKGTGLGLSTVYGIVKQSGGHISVESDPGKGTAFHIYFPRHDRGEIEAPAEAKSTSTPVTGETVLLVEDDLSVLDLARSILTRGGYKVISAPNAQRALRIATEILDHIDLVATDVVMPGMSGRELADGLERLRPGLKVLYMSGYASETTRRYGVPGAGTHFLEKPYRSADLLKAVREAIDAEVPAGH